jgi:hypothetical protein
MEEQQFVSINSSKLYSLCRFPLSPNLSPLFPSFPPFFKFRISKHEKFAEKGKFVVLADILLRQT